MDGVAAKQFGKRQNIRYGAEQDVERVIATGQTLFRIDEPTDGDEAAHAAWAGRQNEYIDKSLREALTDALEEVATLTDIGAREALEDQITDAHNACAEIMRLGVGDVEVKARACVGENDPIKWVENAADLIKVLGERCEALLAEAERTKDARMKDGTEQAAEPRASRPQKARIIRPAFGKRRPRCGSTTGTIPGLFDAANDVVEVRDTVP